MTEEEAFVVKKAQVQTMAYFTKLGDARSDFIILQLPFPADKRLRAIIREHLADIVVPEIQRVIDGFE